MPVCAYIGAVERVYPAYLDPDPDGPARTLVARPGMAPVQLPDVPGDGCWQQVGTDTPPGPEKVTETAPEPSKTTSSAKARKGTA